MIAFFAVVIDIKKLLSQRMSDGKAGGPMRKYLLRLHIWFRIRFVGYPKFIKFPVGSCR